MVGDKNLIWSECFANCTTRSTLYLNFGSGINGDSEGVQKYIGELPPHTKLCNANYLQALDNSYYLFIIILLVPRLACQDCSLQPSILLMPVQTTVLPSRKFAEHTRKDRAIIPRKISAQMVSPSVKSLFDGCSGAVYSKTSQV